MSYLDNYALTLFNDVNKAIIQYDNVSRCTGLVERLFFEQFKSCLSTGIAIIKSGRKLHWDKENDLLFIANEGRIDIYYVNKIAFLALVSDDAINFGELAETLWNKFDLRYVQKFLHMTNKSYSRESLQEFILQCLFPMLISGNSTQRSRNFVFSVTDKICVAHYYWGCTIDVQQGTVMYY